LQPGHGWWKIPRDQRRHGKMQTAMGFLAVIDAGRWLPALLVVAVTALAACGPRPGAEVLQPVRVPPAPQTQIVSVLVATTRAPDPVMGFSADRSPVLHYARYDISIPPNHLPGEIEWPDQPPDPATQFVTVGHEDLTQAQFEREVARRATNATPGEPRASIFVHGFNYTFAESLFRMAQLVSEAGEQGAPVLFAWPSEARVSMYTADKDGATFSRDGLVHVIARTRAAAGRDVLVFGHSMGGWLTVEAIRQLSLTGQTEVLGDTRVVLAAPDIDTDVFVSQLRSIRRLEKPMVVLVSRDDFALGFSRFISGSRPRIGAIDIQNPLVQEEARRTNIQIIDISSIEPSDLLHHSRFVALAGLRSRFEGATPPPPLRSAGVFIFEALGTTLDTAGEVFLRPAR
jgi:esterase/lipase superfamily enzyme